MDENEDRYAAVVAELEKAMKAYGFTQLQRPTAQAITFYRSPDMGNQDKIEDHFRKIIESHQLGMYGIDWSQTNYQRLSITLGEPNEDGDESPKKTFQYSHQTYYDTIKIEQDKAVKGTIGANINGRMTIYVPKSNNEDIYVTIVGPKYEYVECDATNLPEGVKVKAGFPVLVNKAKKAIVGVDPDK